MRGICTALVFTAFCGLAFAETGCYSDCALLIFEQEDGCFGDGTVIDGPVRFNETPITASSTPGRDNDPWFYSFTTAADSFLTMMADTIVWILAADPHPRGTNLWIEPYGLMSQGPPWFNLGADPIPFGQNSVDWETVYTTAQNSGVFYDGLLSGTRIILEADSIHLRQIIDSPVESYCVSDLEEPVVGWTTDHPTGSTYARYLRTAVADCRFR